MSSGNSTALLKIRRHKEEILEQKKMVEKDLQALESFVARK
jgi:hypothetical protein